MNVRKLVMVVAFAGSAYLAFFADKQPESPASTDSAPVGAVAGVAQTDQPAPALSRHTRAASPVASASLPDAAGLRVVARAPFRPLKEVPERPAGAFDARNWEPPPPPPPRMKGPPPPPQAPPLPYTVLGKQVRSGSWEVFLARGKDVRVARPDTVLDGQYRVVAIQPPQMTLMYLPLQQAQTLDIGAAK